MNSKIICGDLIEFTQVCAELVRQGVVFKAHASCLTIRLTGGY